MTAPLYEYAEAAHDVWAHWMKYMFTQGKHHADGTWTMPADKVERWERLMSTDFPDLTDAEQVSDYEIAKEYFIARGLAE